ncbi:MAG: hypothetical protein RJA47_1760 [Actinomycetota bacterium]|jgi:hypothetical protein
MYTYDVVSESMKNPKELANELSRRSQAGWEVVQIVHDGEHWVHAFVRHHGQVATAPWPTASASAGSPAAEKAPAPASDSPWQTATTAPSSAGFAAAQTQSPAQTGGAVPSVPANWYKDPSGRFEMRYWNGTEWTEHVATAGKQSIDPPKK